MKRKALILIMAAVLLIAAVFTAIAVTRPSAGEGQYHRDIIDRVVFSVDPTHFSFVKTEQGDGTCELEFTLTAKKTEADFYAVLHTAELEGLDYESMIFQTAAGDAYAPQDLMLPAENGKAVPVTWTVRVRLASAAALNTDFSLVLRYTSGMTQETAEEHVLRIPMQIVFD